MIKSAKIMNDLSPIYVNYDVKDKETKQKLDSLVNMYDENKFIFTLTDSVYIEAYKRNINVEAIELENNMLNFLHDIFPRDSSYTDFEGNFNIKTKFGRYYSGNRISTQEIVKTLLHIHQTYEDLSKIQMYLFRQFNEGNSVQYQVDFTYQNKRIGNNDGLEFFRTFEASEIIPVIIYIDPSQSIKIKTLSTRDGKTGNYENFNPPVSSIVSKNDPRINVIYFYFKTGQVADDISRPSAYRYVKVEYSLEEMQPIIIKSEFGRVDIRESLKNKIGEFEVDVTDLADSCVITFYDIEINIPTLRGIIVSEDPFRRMFYVNDKNLFGAGKFELIFYPSSLSYNEVLSENFHDTKIILKMEQGKIKSQESIHNENVQLFEPGTNKVVFKASNLAPQQSKEAIYYCLSKLISFYNSDEANKYKKFFMQTKFTFSGDDTVLKTGRKDIDMIRRISSNSATLSDMLKGGYESNVAKVNWPIFEVEGTSDKSNFPHSYILEGILIKAGNVHKPNLYIEKDSKYIICSEKKISLSVFENRLNLIKPKTEVKKIFDVVSNIIGCSPIHGISSGNDLKSTFRLSVYNVLKRHFHSLSNVREEDFVNFMLNKVHPSCLRQELFDLDNDEAIKKDIYNNLEWDRHIRLIEVTFSINIYVFGIPPGKRKVELLKPRCKGCYIRPSINKKCLVIIMEKYLNSLRAYCSDKLLDKEIDASCSTLFNEKYNYDVFTKFGVVRLLFKDQNILGNPKKQSIDKNGKCAGIITEYKGKTFGIIFKYFIQPLNVPCVDAKVIYTYTSTEKDVITNFGDNCKVKKTKIEYDFFSVITKGKINKKVTFVDIKKNYDIFMELLVLLYKMLAFYPEINKEKYLKLISNSDSTYYDFSGLPCRIPVSNYRLVTSSKPDIVQYLQILNSYSPSVSDGENFLIRGDTFHQKLRKFVLPKLERFSSDIVGLQKSIYINTIANDIRNFTKPNTILFTNEVDYLKIMRSNKLLQTKSTINLMSVLSYQPFIYDDGKFVFLVQNISRMASSKVDFYTVNATLKICKEWKEKKMNSGHEVITGEMYYQELDYILYEIGIDGKIFQKERYNRRIGNNDTSDPLHILVYYVRGRDNYFALLPF